MFKFMAKSRQEKQGIIGKLKDRLSQQKAAILLDFSGVDSSTFFALRDELKENEGNLMVVKKTLLKLALSKIDAGKMIEKIDEIEGQLALAFGLKNEITPAKICYKYSKENENLKLLGAIIKNKQHEFIDLEKVLELAQLPSKQELLARLVGSLKAPVNNFVYVLKGNLNNLVYLLSEIQKVKS